MASLSSSDTWYYDDDQYASSRPWAEESYECKNYKDDDYYTADLYDELHAKLPLSKVPSKHSTES